MSPFKDLFSTHSLNYSQFRPHYSDELFNYLQTLTEGHSQAWDAGTGRVGFLTLCKICHLQVDFMIDNELTEMQDNQWRECRTLS